MIRLENVKIITAEGPDEVPNPLYAYKFHPIHSSFYGSYSGDDYTVRNPPRGARSPRSSRPDALVQYVLESLPVGYIYVYNRFRALSSYDAREETFEMLTLIKNWNNFSNHTYAPQQGAVANSLEAIHDNIHGLVGGSGHMGNIAYAGELLLYVLSLSSDIVSSFRPYLLAPSYKRTREYSATDEIA